MNNKSYAITFVLVFSSYILLSQSKNKLYNDNEEKIESIISLAKEENPSLIEALFVDKAKLSIFSAQQVDKDIMDTIVSNIFKVLKKDLIPDNLKDQLFGLKDFVKLEIKHNNHIVSTVKADYIGAQYVIEGQNIQIQEDGVELSLLLKFKSKENIQHNPNEFIKRYIYKYTNYPETKENIKFEINDKNGIYYGAVICDNLPYMWKDVTVCTDGSFCLISVIIIQEGFVFPNIGARPDRF